jgi:Ig-like domain from next to BRCA1 gene
MSFKLINRKFVAGMIIILILTGCTTVTATVAPAVPPTTAPTTDQLPTLNLVRTQAVQTALANLTLTAPTATPVLPTATLVLQTTLALPTGTPAPSATSVPSNTPLPSTALPTSASVRFTLVPSLSPTPLAYSCYVLDVSPKPADKITTESGFDGRWVVVNTGTAAWPHLQTDIRYVSGEKFQTKGDIVDLESDVASSSSYTVYVNMKAPKYTGIYYATWAIKFGDQTVCNLNLAVTVIK